MPTLKQDIRDIFLMNKSTECVIIQIDDLYHLKRTDQAFVVDYIHRLCKDVPLYFKIATMRHASTLFVEQSGQPIGAQERHDYQPIDIDYTFNNFPKTAAQNWNILRSFSRLDLMKASERFVRVRVSTVSDGGWRGAKRCSITILNSLIRSGCRS